MRNTQIKIKVPRDIEGEVITKIEDAYFPPIVELYPELNALSIPEKEQEAAYLALKDSFESLKKGGSAHKLLEECLLTTEKTFLWFCTFFKELEKIISNKRDTYEIPYTLTPKNKTKTFLYFQYPMYVTKQNETYIVHYRKYRGNTLRNELLNKHRTELISQRLEYTDFKNGFPNWYVISHVVFEKYSEKINKRVKLLYNSKGEFEYYICGASDNWEQIFNVPLEIDDVIACILFND